MTTPFPMVEMAVKELIETRYAPALGNVGGDLSYDGGELYVWLGLVPGGRTDQLEGQWVLDIDCFASTYAAAMQAALALEALLVGSRHVTSVMLLDRCTQNESPSERPWEAESAYRVGAVYVFTARRGGGTITLLTTVPVVPPVDTTGPGNYTHTQTTPSGTWIVTHGLNGYPYPTIILTGETEAVYTDIDYPDLNTMVLTFPTAVSGKVYL